MIVRDRILRFNLQKVIKTFKLFSFNECRVVDSRADYNVKKLDVKLLVKAAAK